MKQIHVLFKRVENTLQLTLLAAGIFPCIRRGNDAHLPGGFGRRAAIIFVGDGGRDGWSAPPQRDEVND